MFGQRPFGFRAFTFVKTISIGLRSGLQGGKYKHRHRRGAKSVQAAFSSKGRTTRGAWPPDHLRQHKAAPSSFGHVWQPAQIKAFHREPDRISRLSSRISKRYVMARVSSQRRNATGPLHAKPFTGRVIGASVHDFGPASFSKGFNLDLGQGHVVPLQIGKDNRRADRMPKAPLVVMPITRPPLIIASEP